MTASRGAKERTRNQVKMKVLKERPVHLQPQGRKWEQAEDSDSEADIQLDQVGRQRQQQRQVPDHPEAEDSDSEVDIQLDQVGRQQQRQVQNDLIQERDTGGPEGEEDQAQLRGAEELVQVEHPDTNTGARRSGRACRAPERYGDVLRADQDQLSPRNRKRIQSLAKRKVPREQWRIKQTRKDSLVIVIQKTPKTQNT